MKYLKKFESKDEHKDLVDKVFNTIITIFSKDNVLEILNDEILNWVDDDLKANEWYKEHGNGEAEDVVLDGLLSWYIVKYGTFDLNAKSEVYNKLKDHYGYIF